jgi:hypothetical protein
MRLGEVAWPLEAAVQPIIGPLLVAIAAVATISLR